MLSPRDAGLCHVRWHVLLPAAHLPLTSRVMGIRSPADVPTSPHSLLPSRRLGLEANVWPVTIDGCLTSQPRLHHCRITSSS